MNNVILTEKYAEPPFSQREILRYAGCGEPDSEILKLMDSCISEAREKLVYKACYRELSLSVKDDICNFGAFGFKSKNLAVNLKDCKRVIVFAATVGVEIDRLITKYSRISPLKALFFQAIGAERIETVCDTFCSDIAKEYGCGLKPRFSPGYGDLPLEVQRDIFSVLNPEKNIGLFLNESLLMSPSKSVTAFLGLCDNDGEQINIKCSACNKSNCDFRRAL